MGMFDVLWALLILPLIGWEVYAIANKTDGDTFSERTRAWFHTSTVPGRVMFLAAWVGLAVWYPVHILVG